MKLMKVTPTTRSTLEFAAIEAENNRRAVKQLRMVLRRIANSTADKVSAAHAVAAFTVLSETTPSKIRGLK